MASVKVKFRPSVLADGKGTVCYQVIHERKSMQILTDYHLFSSEWNDVRSNAVNDNGSERKSKVCSIIDGIHRDLDRLSAIISKLNKKGKVYTVDDVAAEFHRYMADYSLFRFMENMIVRLRNNGRIRTSETYKAALKSFKTFRGNEDIMIDSIDSDLMEAYEGWHRSSGKSLNTVSFYNRIIRAVYNRALENEIIEDRNPFRHIYTGIDKTVKRALTLSILKRIKALDLTLRPALDYARDIFILSFMLRGMSFIDIAYLKKSDLTDGYVRYRRHKTGQLLTVEWTKEMQSILEKYPENTGPYLLPIIINPETDERRAYMNASDRINHNLKKIAKMVDVSFPLSLYVARHSWASIAWAEGVPVSLISEGMGHDSELTTRIYIESLDDGKIDRVNSMLINLL